MTQRAVQELPVFGRDMSRLYFLVPGVQATGTSAPSEQPHDIFRPTIGGQYWGGISFQLDGTDNRDSVLGEPVITPNLDSVAELKITTTSYDAEFGQASQAIIASHTKSGTNTLHGSLFEYRRDQHGAARDPFAQAQPIVGTNGKFIPPTLWNQFGGSFGGPIQKDKTFLLRRLPGQPAAQRRLPAHPRSHRCRTHRRSERSQHPDLSIPATAPIATSLPPRASSSPATSSRRTCSRRRHRIC